MTKLNILFDHMRWEEKALHDACVRKGIDFSLLNAEKVYFDLTSKERPSGIGDVVLQRCVSHFRGLHAAAALESYGIKVINKYTTAELCGNKVMNTIIFKKAGIPTPRTYLAFTPEATIRALDELGYPAILKPVVGSWGRLVSLLKDKTSATVALEHREMMFPLYQIYYAQEMVKRPPRDLRVFVIGEDVPVAIYRVNNTDDWRTNTARGGKVERCPITPEIRELALKAADAVGGGVFGVDMMEDGERLVVHEINSTVEFKNTVPATGIDIPGMIVDYAIREGKR
ncbi:MAG: lysine biosynthesis protein LysX [Candidatus Verstraetearchaeota archaeon]|nr:lysine biosynthesis protein LysX [Candidatus Verstraetearchaeota archaeon]